MAVFATSGTELYIDGVKLGSLLKFDMTSRRVQFADVSNLSGMGYKEFLPTLLDQAELSLWCISDRADPGQQALHNFGQSLKLEIHYPNGAVTQVPGYVKDITMHSEPSSIDTTQVKLLACGGMVTCDPDASIEEIEDYDFAARY